MPTETDPTETSVVPLPASGKSRRVFLLLRDEIASGQRAPGSALPSEQQLARIHDVSRVTVRRALDALLRDDLITKRPGSGSIVRAPVPAIAADMTTLIPQIQAMGRQTSARLISFAYEAAAPHVAGALRLAEGARVQHAVRIRLADGVPFSHLTTYVPEDIAQTYSEADLAGAPLFDLLERSGVRIERAHQSISATLASPDLAEVLEVSVGSALVSLTRVTEDAEGRGVEYLSALYRPDRFRLEMDLARTGGGRDRHWAPVIQKGGAA